MLFQRIQQGRSKPKVASHELGGIFRAVDSSKIKHEVCLLAIIVQRQWIGIDVVLEYVFDGE